MSDKPDADQKPRELTKEEKAELEKAKQTILRLQGPPPPAPEGAPAGPMVLKRFKVRLEGVTCDTRKKQVIDRDCTCRAQVRGPDGQPREVTLDRSVVSAYHEAEAWSKFMKAWGIRATDHTPSFSEVVDLTEGVDVGIPPPAVLPIVTPGMMTPRPDSLPLPAGAQGSGVIR